MIKLIREEEHERLIEIWDGAVRSTHHFLKVEDFEYYKSQLHIYFHCVKLYGYYDTNDRLVGFLGVSHSKVEMLFVDCRSMNKGVGRCLLTFAIKELCIKKLDVNEQNTQAVGFYAHMGFKVVSRVEVDGEGKPYPLLCLQLDQIQ